MKPSVSKAGVNRQHTTGYFTVVFLIAKEEVQSLSKNTVFFKYGTDFLVIIILELFQTKTRSNNTSCVRLRIIQKPPVLRH